MQNRPRRNPTPDDIIIGVKPVEEALLAGKTIDKVLMQRGLQGEAVKELRLELRKHGVWIQDVPPAKLDRITRKNHQGVIAMISPIAFHDVEQVLPGLYEAGKIPLFVALDGITDVRNFGAIARSAECLGAHAVIVPSKSTARIGPDAVKTSAGALLRIPVCKVNDLGACLRYFQQSGIQNVGLTEHAEHQLDQVDYSAPTCLVLGSESHGIHPEIAKYCDKGVKIPMTGAINSLNVSVAAGIALYAAASGRAKE